MRDAVGTLALWVVGLCIGAAIAVPVQLFLWWRDEVPVLQALFTEPIATWGLSVFLGILAAEHLRHRILDAVERWHRG